MMKETSIDITPDKTLIKKVGLAGYRTTDAVAELVDNSIDARIGRVNIAVVLDFVNGQITVSDDGRGMDRDDVRNALTVARETKRDGSLGRFGMGMKSSCSALGEIFEIKTSKKGTATEYAATYDEEKWLSDNSLGWDSFKINEKTLDAPNDWHGTKVTIRNLKVPLYASQVTAFKKNFGLRYGPYLRDGLATIRINTVFCKPHTYETVDGSRQAIDIRTPTGRRIKGHVELLKKRSIGGSYGIHLYKYDRLIKPYVKFGFPQHPENAMIIGRINLEHVPVNFQKNDFIMESAEYKEALHAFRSSDVARKIQQHARSRSSDGISVESVFGFFSKANEAPHMGTRMSSKNARDLLGGTEPFEMEMGGRTVQIIIRRLKSGPLYTVEAGPKPVIVINWNNRAFDYVKNPLFLMGMIASELGAWSGSADDFVAARNESLDKFLAGASAGKIEGPVRDREIPVPDIPGYDLEPELVDLHEYLRENHGKKFQFTAMSTLVPYLHNLRGRIVYTLHTSPGCGDDMADMLNQEFGSRITTVDQPDAKTLRAILGVQKTDKIIAVREFRVIRGSTIAEPEKAIVDLAVESSTYGIPIEDSEVRRILQNMIRKGLIDDAKMRRHARFVKKESMLEDMIKA